MQILRPTRRTTPTLTVALLLAGCSGEAPKQAAPPPPAVVVAPVRLEDLSAEHTYTGRIEAIDKVQVRARVQGFLMKRLFDEGGDVKKGQQLFEIDPEPFVIAVEQAKANLANANAAEELAQVTFERQKELADRNSAALSKAAFDQAKASLAQAQAQVQARQADLRSAQVNLSYTKIEAPFDGRIGRAAYSVGDLVGPSSNPLVTIVAQDPVYVTFPVPQRVLIEARKNATDADAFFVQLRLSDGTVYNQKGAITFVDVQATSSTDSVIVRARMANPQRLLVDQQLVEVLVVRKQAEPKLVMSQSALLLDQQGPFVLAVGADNKVEQRRIRTGVQSGPLIVVEEGLAAGDNVIVTGQQRARPGAVVAPQSEQPLKPAPQPQASK